uniref:Tapasin-like n=2 Tax=Podarcis muralis TaxID=64176 RepID=A0A670K0P5_PODMU
MPARLILLRDQRLRAARVPLCPLGGGAGGRRGLPPRPWRGASGLHRQHPGPPTPSSGSAASCTPRRPRLGSSRMASAAVTTTAAVLSVFTRTPRLESRLGRPAVLHCGFSAPASAFSVEWRHQFRGAGKVVLAFDGASRGVSVAEEGAELLLDAEGGGASLCLRSVAVRHEGTYICTVYLPHLHAQQALEFKVVEPPQVTLRPTTLSVPPGARPQLACEVSGFFPLGASVSWKRRGSGAPQDAFLDIGDSGHRQAPDGTFSFTSFARLLPVPTEDHGVSYVCHVGHAGLGEAGVKKAVVLHVAGSLGPSLEDAIGLFLVAIVLLGVLRSFFRWASEEKPKSEKPKSE